ASALVVASLVLAPWAAGSVRVLGATGTITSSGTSYTLTVANTGDQPIHCVSLFAPAGVKITSAAGPQQTLPFSDGSGFGYGGEGIAPAASAAFTFTTDQPYPPNTGTLQVSADCQTNVAAPLSGPAEPPCKCTALTASIAPKTIALQNARATAGMQLGF